MNPTLPSAIYLNRTNFPCFYTTGEHNANTFLLASAEAVLGSRWPVCSIHHPWLCRYFWLDDGQYQYKINVSIAVVVQSISIVQDYESRCVLLFRRIHHIDAGRVSVVGFQLFVILATADSSTSGIGVQPSSICLFQRRLTRNSTIKTAKPMKSPRGATDGGMKPTSDNLSGTSYKIGSEPSRERQ